MTSAMLKRGALTVFLVGALGVGALVPDAASAGEAGELDAKLAKQRSGPFQHGLEINIADGTAKSVYLKVKNRTTEDAVAAELSQFLPEEDWVTKYFRRTHNITAAVQSNGYNFDLRAGKAKLFRIRIKAPEAPDDTCVTSTVASLDLDGDFATVRVNGALLCAVPT